MPSHDRYRSGCNFGATISARVLNALETEKCGQVRRAALTANEISEEDLNTALGLEWRRKIEVEVRPGMPIEQVREICSRIAEHNQLVARLARFWELLRNTLVGSDERSPWLELRTQEALPDGEGTAPAILMVWRDGIHPSWNAPTVHMDATMQAEIVQVFFPNLDPLQRISAPMPHAYIRQITDRAMMADMLIPTASAKGKTNSTRRANVERIRRYLQVRAFKAPGNVLVICQLRLEVELRKGALPPNVEIRHFNAIAGQNAWEDVVLLIVIGRTEPSARTTELQARALFGADVQEIEADQRGQIKYPRMVRGIRMRDGHGIAVEGPYHPDPRVESVRWATCEAGLLQAIGRGRGVNRGPDNPLHVDILNNIVLPIEVDEVTTWDAIQPGAANVMAAAGAVPFNYTDIAAAYPDLFPSSAAARMTLSREAKKPRTNSYRGRGAPSRNPEQTPIESPLGEDQNPEQTPIVYLLGVCSGFSRQRYRRGARGPASELFYDPARINPREWLLRHVGEITMLGPGMIEVQTGNPDALPVSATESVIEHRTRLGLGEPPAPVVPDPAIGDLTRGPFPSMMRDGETARAEMTQFVALSQDQLGSAARYTVVPNPGDWSDIEEERSAIIESQAGVPKAWAEAFARFDASPLPEGVPGERWQRFIDDVGRFLDSGFAERARALGWRPFDLLGCDRDRPLGSVDACGLLWLLDGRRLVALSESTALIETYTGARQTFRRRPEEIGRVLAWELAP